MSGLVSRAVTTCGLMALLATCVRFEAYTVLYIAFSMPGIAEFVTMSLHDGGAEAVAGAAAGGAGARGAGGGSAAPGRVVSAAIAVAYVYNSALALGSSLFNGFAAAATSDPGDDGDGEVIGYKATFAIATTACGGATLLGMAIVKATRQDAEERSAAARRGNDVGG